MYFYTMFHKNIKSNFELYEAIPVAPFDDADITIEETDLPQFIVDDISNGKVDGRADNFMWFYLKGSYVFYIKDGSSIIIHNMGDAPDHIVRNCFLTGLAMAIALTQQGYIPLHGSVLQKDGQAVIISGISGSGKSSTALELMRQGYQFMADDVAVVDSENRVVLPGFPMQRLCRDVVDRLGLDEDRLIYLGEEKDKYGYLLEKGQYTYERLPMKAIIYLNVGEELEVHRISGMQKVWMLIQNTYCNFFYEKDNIPTDVLKKYFRVAEQVELYEIVRPREGNSLQDVVSQINKRILQCC